MSGGVVSGGPAVPAAAYALALSLLPGVGPVSLQALLTGGDPERAWGDVQAGRARRPAGRRGPQAPNRLEWDVAARSMDVAGTWARTRRAGIGVTWSGAPDYPGSLCADPQPPAVLFWRGMAEALDGPCVALVGTRHATAAGRDLAFELGRDLAGAGVCVVSGLALGIDGAAHRGALSTRRQGATVGVAASGVDRPYPQRHRDLWEEVVGLGAVISETPPGRAAQTWRFPARNRIIAGLVSLVVVVESHSAGGSMITVEAALERGVAIGAVPGPVRSPASAGTNQLLYEGAGPVRDATDVLIALGSVVAGGPVGPVSRRRQPPAGPPVPDDVGPDDVVGSDDRAVPDDRVVPDDRAVPDDMAVPAAHGLLDAMGWQPRSLNWLVARSGRDLTGVAADLERFAAAGQVREERGWWQRLR